MLTRPWPENLTLTEDQYWVEIDLLQYKQQINIAKAIPILVPTLFSLFRFDQVENVYIPWTRSFSQSVDSSRLWQNYTQIKRRVVLALVSVILEYDSTLMRVVLHWSHWLPYKKYYAGNLYNID